MRTLVLMTPTVFAVCLAITAAATPVPEGGIGVTSAPDSVTAIGEVNGQCPGGWVSGTSPAGASFGVFDVGEWNDWVDLDVDFLIDENFSTHSGLLNPVSDHEATRLLRSLDLEHDNRFGWASTDLALTYRGFGETEYGLYDPEGEDRHFLLFPLCPDSVDSENGHVDVYLTPAKYDQEHPTPDWLSSAQYTSAYTVPAEDWPPDAGPEWKKNAISITDNFGKRVSSSDTTWFLTAAVGALHEFTHACWESNVWTRGLHEITDPWGYPGGPTSPYVEGGDYNEFFACAAGYFAKSPAATFGSDMRYAYSLLDDGMTPCEDPSVGGVSTRNQRYHLWPMFGAYLGYQFTDPDTTIEMSLLSRWARSVTDWGGGNVGTDRSFCGLAGILDSSEFSSLGYAPAGEYEGHDGWYRLNGLFSDYGIARYVDCSDEVAAYGFGPDYSAYTSAGQFQKVDNDTAWSFNALWEYAIPPEFVLDNDNLGTWTSYPAQCPDGDPGDVGWQDVLHPHNHHTTGIYHGCVPVQVDLWGSNYLAFRADTLAFGWCSADTLVVQFSWVDTNDINQMNPRAELWLSVLRYECSVPDLFGKGSRLRSGVETQRYRYPTTGAVVHVPAFRRDANEAVVIVLTVVPTDHGPQADPLTGACQRRDPDFGEDACMDLHYSYRFRVQSNPPEPPGGGCPFVSSFGASGYASDNNVLAAAWAGGDDVLDTYLLRQRPEVVDGMYRLRLTETEDERSRLDGIELLAIDHAAGANVAVFADGTIGTYRVTGEPVACRDQDGNDVLDLVLRSDGENATVKAGGWLDVVFRSEGATRSGGGIGEDGGPGQKIEQPGRGDAEDGAMSLASQCYRANPCVSILDMPEGVVPDDGLITLKLTAPTDYGLDRLFMTERSEDPIAITRCALSDAQHSEFTSCMSALAADDGVYASLAQGDTIDLMFSVPKTATDERDFVLRTRGGEVSRGSGELTEQPEAAAATISAVIAPNPFNPSTTISFNVPGAGGHVAVSIYNMAGKLVRQMADTDMQSGQHTLTWDGRGESGESLGSGVYFCRIETPGQSDQKKLVLLK